MPVVRYFTFVGGALLVLLLVANAWLPAAPPAKGSGSVTDLSVIRIHSDHKWPERVVFDTTRPSITPAPAAIAQAPSPTKSASAEPPKSQVREAFAELRPNPSPDEHRSREPKRKRRVAKSRPWPARMMVAQQPPFFLFGNNSGW